MTDQTNDVSVKIIVLNWNGKDDTLECLDSLSKIDFPKYTMTVVDNASTDGSVDAIRLKYPELNIIENDSNLMYAGGNNVGLEQGLKEDADLFLILNNDTTVKEDFLSHLVMTSFSDENTGIVAPKILYSQDPDRIWYAGGIVNFITGNIYHKGLRKRNSSKYDLGEEIDYATGCCMLIKRDVLEEIGLLDDDYYIYTEDVDLSFRARIAGYKIVYEPNAIIWHKVSAATGGGLTPFKIINKMKSNFRFFKTYANWYHWLTIPIMVFLRTVLFMFNRVMRGDVKSVIAVLNGFSNWKKRNGVANNNI